MLFICFEVNLGGILCDRITALELVAEMKGEALLSWLGFWKFFIEFIPFYSRSLEHEFRSNDEAE